MPGDNIKIAKPFTCTELATLYNVSRKTFRTWLLPHMNIIGEKKAKYFTTRQVRLIYRVLGFPYEEMEEES